MEAIVLLEKGIRLFPDIENLERLLASLLFNSGQYSRAKPLLVKYKNYHDEFLKLVKVKEFESDYKGAVDILRQRISEDSTNIEYLTHLGDNYSQLDSTNQAIDVYEKLIVLNPNDQLTLSKLANILLIQKEYRKSISICESALKLDSTNKRIVRIKGIAEFRNVNFGAAVSSFTYLFENGDSGIVVLKHLGISESKSYAYHESRKHLQMAYSKDSTDYEICFFLARAYLNSMTPEKGLYYLEKADSLLQADPAILATIYVEKASIFNTLNMYDEVLYNYKLCHKITAKPEYLYFIGSVYDNRFDNKAKAFEYYTKFITDLPVVSLEENYSLKNQQSISMKKIALDRLEVLKEELFFEGSLDNE
jgi:tetratricopeptide (TPR) repeat protein